MDQPRSDPAPTPPSTASSQNVHLHMHHVCACQGIYPPANYYPQLSYHRTPLIPYGAQVAAAAAAAAARPYLQHYQYTQFNVAGQYATPAATAPLPSANFQANQSAEPETGANVVEPTEFEFGAAAAQASNAATQPPMSATTPTSTDLFLIPEDLQTNTDNFIKFLERSCLTAEQIAYRNRNRPCFRNIQNLCIRTRSEILKPRTTISNIHSQGIPWATKDFIYAFVRLTNCWHILKGYWENRDGAALGKIEKELTPGFKACYVRWEKETVELAMELTRIFYNLDLNQSSNNSGATIVPPQVSLLNKQQKNEAGAQTIRGILQHAGAPVAPETMDQGNQTSFVPLIVRSESSDQVLEDDAVLSTQETEIIHKTLNDEPTLVYMKPGSYRVPKKFANNKTNSNNGGKRQESPRMIEFLETAQNITKGLETINDKYWVKINKKLEDNVGEDKVLTSTTATIGTHHVASANEVFFNVHEWLTNCNFTDCGGNDPHLHQQQSSTSNNSNSPPKIDVYDVPTGGNKDGSGNSGLMVLQRIKNSNKSNNDQIPSRTYRRKCEMNLNGGSSGNNNVFLYEMKNGGFTKKGHGLIEKMLFEMKKVEMSSSSCTSNNDDDDEIDDDEMDDDNGNNNAEDDEFDLETIIGNFNCGCYRFVNEIVRDLRYLINSKVVGCDDKHLNEHVKNFNCKLDGFLSEQFPNFDFSFIVGKKDEKVGKLKIKSQLFDGGDDNLNINNTK